MKNSIIALADASNFYVSVERSYNSSIQTRPVVVLSNGDGNIVAASQEAKALGLQRGTPYFQVQSLIKHHNVVTFSSNYELYQNASDRIVQILSNYAEVRDGVRQLENYSIDESFLSVSHIAPEHLHAYGHAIREHILRATGVPLRLGFASTKQLSKVAAFLIKAHPEQGEVLSLVGMAETELDNLLSTVPVEELWGIGSKLSNRLRLYGIDSGKSLRDADSAHVRRIATVTGARVQLELRGLPCLPLEITPPKRKAVMYSRGFRKAISQEGELREAVATYTARAAAKLRGEQAMASSLSLFITTNPFDHRTPQYSRSASATLQFPTSFTPDLIRVALSLLQQVYRGGFLYKRAGVFLSGVVPEDVIQPDLFGSFSLEQEAKKARLMSVIDLVNERWGKEAVYVGDQGVERDWEQKPQWLSPRSTTRWSELIRVT